MRPRVAARAEHRLYAVKEDEKGLTVVSPFSLVACRSPARRESLSSTVAAAPGCYGSQIVPWSCP
jgi:hypothetical protein